MEKKIIRSINITKEMHDTIKAMAVAEGRSFNNMVMEILKKGLKEVK